MTASATSADGPLLVFDGDCGFCTTCAEWLEAHREQPLRIAPYQVLELEDLALDKQDVTRFAWWLDGGTRARGHRAIGRALLACRRPWPIVGRLILLPPFSWLGTPVYRLIANMRGRLPGSTAACRRPEGR